MLAGLHLKNVVAFRGVDVASKAVDTPSSTVLELATCDLEKDLKGSGCPLTEDGFRSICEQVLKASEYFHSRSPPWREAYQYLVFVAAKWARHDEDKWCGLFAFRWVATTSHLPTQGAGSIFYMAPEGGGW
jgi:hypothetical protein